MDFWIIETRCWSSVLMLSIAVGVGLAIALSMSETMSAVVWYTATIALNSVALTVNPITASSYTVVPRSFVTATKTEITGGEEAERLLEVIRKGEQMARDVGKKEEERNARALGELGIGINPAATMTCNMLEDEKVWRTVHFAIGMNLDNDGQAFIHQDCLVKRPSLWVDGKLIMKDGDILI